MNQKEKKKRKEKKEKKIKNLDFRDDYVSGEEAIAIISGKMLYATYDKGYVKVCGVGR